MREFVAQFTNPFTQSLMANVQNDELHMFVRQWDTLEGLIVGIFRNKRATAADAQLYLHVQSDLVSRLPNWQTALHPHWQGKKIGGQIAQADPFAALIAPNAASDFIGNLRLMQTLPAAREALNEMIVQLSKPASTI
ncbi:MAG: hypothetical protein KIH69_017055 [Anaerolineae bacterium]|nr:hypothetical protein [Anaerolineae bacterium]